MYFSFNGRERNDCLQHSSIPFHISFQKCDSQYSSLSFLIKLWFHFVLNEICSARIWVSLFLSSVSDENKLGWFFIQHWNMCANKAEWGGWHKETRISIGNKCYGKQSILETGFLFGQRLQTNLNVKHWKPQSNQIEWNQKLAFSQFSGDLWHFIWSA